MSVVISDRREHTVFINVFRCVDLDISYDEAAQIACCSPFYFQRLFSYVSGISLSEYIRRRRMTQAAFELQRTNAKVIDIALKYGYTSPTSFNRAFQSVHNIPPDCRTQSGKHVKRIPRNSFFSSNHRRKCYGISHCREISHAYGGGSYSIIHRHGRKL